MKASRIAHEKKTVELMIRLYCRKKEKNRFFVKFGGTSSIVNK